MAAAQPKRPVGGAYGQFLTEKRAEFSKLCQGKPTEVAKLAGEAWKKLSDADKAPYVKAFEEAKKAFETDMAAFVAAGGVVSKGAAALRTEKRKAKEAGGKAKKAKKDPNAPKRPAGGAYMCFLTANRKDFEKECPGDVTGVTKLASAKWKEASQADKDKYEQEYQAKKAAYEEAMKSYVPPVVEEEEKDEKTTEGKASKQPKITFLQAKKAEAAEKKAKTAADKAASSKTGRGRKAGKPAEPEVEIPKEISDKAEKAGLNQVLKKLMGRDDIKAGDVKPDDALVALEKSGGLLHKAREALLLSGA